MSYNIFSFISVCFGYFNFSPVLHHDSKNNHHNSVISIFSLNILTPLLSTITLLFRFFKNKNVVFHVSEIFIQISECKNIKWGTYCQAMLRRVRTDCCGPSFYSSVPSSSLRRNHSWVLFDYTFLNISYFFKYLTLILKDKYVLKLIIKKTYCNHLHFKVHLL